MATRAYRGGEWVIVTTGSCHRTPVPARRPAVGSRDRSAHQVWITGRVIEGAGGTLAGMADPPDLLARFGTARHPDRPSGHPRPDGTADADVDAAGKVSAALEVVEQARGALYAFHRMSGEADLALQEALAAVREAGHSDLAAEVDEVLVGRDVIPGQWTFQIVEAYDEHYWQVFRAAEACVRDRLCTGIPHVFEAEMKVDEQTRGSAEN